MQIAKLGKEQNIKIVFFSSDYVFNSPNPENLPDCMNIIGEYILNYFQDFTIKILF